jgi:hypothetical protein
MTHQEIDARSLALHRLVADKLRRDPALLRIAKDNLVRWRERATPNDLVYLREWERILEAGLDPALAVATEDSEHASALRQSSPFAGVLSPSERAAFLKDWKLGHAAH